MKVSRLRCLAISVVILFLVSCGGGENPDQTGVDSGNSSCTGNCVNANSFLSVDETQQIIAQGVAEARARGATATIAVTDRVGNVLGVFRMGDMPDDPRNIFIGIGNGANTGLEGLTLPVDHLAAISKAVTGAYLSSEGNAFSTRTASQIVQQNFNPGETNQPGGPLFGVQFSQLACSDFSTRFDDSRPQLSLIGPRRAPLGLAADPGGFPLYKDGAVVGGVGAIADGIYGADTNITDNSTGIDELIATAASFGFAAPVDRRGDRITVDGKTLRFSNANFGQLKTDPSKAPSFSSLEGVAGALIPVTGYISPAQIVDGTIFGTKASGIRGDRNVDYPGQRAFIFVDDANENRFPPSAGTEMPGEVSLTENETRIILQEALRVAERARAQIRRPLGTKSRVTIAVVDSVGEVLGMVRSVDAPVFGADVSLQKARTAALFSSKDAGNYISAFADVTYPQNDQTIIFENYVTAVREFFNDSGALAGQIAFSDRAGGNLSRPFFPDGLSGTQNGPLSKPIDEWSPFSTGFQLDMSFNAIVSHIRYVLGVTANDVAVGCAELDGTALPPIQTGSRLANGSQIFPGSVPIYKNGELVGGIGVSGDGVDQDDMIAFLGLHNASLTLGSGAGNAPLERRADTLTPQGVRLRYIQCPQSPFVDSTEQGVCNGK